MVLMNTQPVTTCTCYPSGFHPHNVRRDRQISSGVPDFPRAQVISSQQQLQIQQQLMQQQQLQQQQLMQQQMLQQMPLQTQQSLQQFPTQRSIPQVQPSSLDFIVPRGVKLKGGGAMFLPTQKVIVNPGAKARSGTRSPWRTPRCALAAPSGPSVAVHFPMVESRPDGL